MTRMRISYWHCPYCTTRIKTYFMNRITTHLTEHQHRKQQPEQEYDTPTTCINCTSAHAKYREAFGIVLCDSCHKEEWEMKRNTTYGDDR